MSYLFFFRLAIPLIEEVTNIREQNERGWKRPLERGSSPPSRRPYFMPGVPFHFHEKEDLSPYLLLFQLSFYRAKYPRTGEMFRILHSFPCQRGEKKYYGYCLSRYRKFLNLIPQSPGASGIYLISLIFWFKKENLLSRKKEALFCHFQKRIRSPVVSKKAFLQRRLYANSLFSPPYV